MQKIQLGANSELKYLKAGALICENSLLYFFFYLFDRDTHFAIRKLLRKIYFF